MKKNPPSGAKWHQNWGRLKFFASLTLLFISMLPLSAKTIAQRDTKITLSYQNASLETVLKKVSRLADVKFVYNNARISKANRLSVDIVEEELSKVLDQILGKEFTWQLVDHYVVISARPVQAATHQRTDTEGIPAEQTVEITGQVVSKDGEPLIGVSVVVKGTTTGVATDINGNFAIKVPPRSVLVFTYIGFQPKEIIASPKMQVVLEEDQQQLDEVMVVAYGTAKKQSFTGSAEVVKSDLLEKRQSSSITTAIQGAVAGVSVINNTAQPGEDAKIRIRGVGSLNSSSEPLWVVDGVPYDGLLNSINPDDIESMTVLKDAASAALYGARAANGVILVTTKKGKSGAPQVSLRAMWGSSSRAVKEYEKVHAGKWMEYQWEALRNGREGLDNGGKTAEQWATDNLLSQVVYSPVFLNGKVAQQPVGIDGKLVAGTEIMWDTDWFDALTRTPFRQEYQLSINGGSETTRYIVSLGYLNDKAITIASGFERYNGRVNVESNIKKWLTAGLSTSFAYSSQNYPNQSGGSTINPYLFARIMAPVYSVYKRDENGNIMVDPKTGEKIFELGDNPKRPNASGQNSVANIALNTIEYQRFSVDPTLFAQVNFTDWLNFRATVAVNHWSSVDDQLYSRLYGDAKGMGRIYKTRKNQLVINANQVLSFNRSFGQHTVGVMLGHESNDITYKYLYVQKTGTFSDDIPEFDMATTMATMSSYTNEITREGYFGRVNYDYASKYFVEGSYRRDASSRFFKDNRWGNFWSVSLGWRISQEDFLKSVQWLDNLKLRGSYGVQGNENLLDATSVADWYAWMGLASGGYNYGGLSGLVYTKLENRKLTWEKNNSMNIGLDVAVLNNTLRASFDYFSRKTTDMLFRLPLPISSGFNAVNKNAGEMKNTGFEMEISSDFLKRNRVSAGATFNLSYIKNEITDLPQEEIIPTDDNTKKWMEGRNPYEYYMYKYAGVNPDNGDALYYYTNPDGSLGTTASAAEADKYYVGSALPKIQLSISPYVNFYNFDLSFMLAGAFGHKIYDNSYSSMMHTGSNIGYAWHKDIAKRWTPDNRYTNVPKLTSVSNDYRVTSTRFLYKGNYMRLRALTLGYTLPESWCSAIGLKMVRVYFQGDNLLTFKSSELPDGTDPEVLSGVQGNNSTASRIYSFGINVHF